MSNDSVARSDDNIVIESGESGDIVEQAIESKEPQDTIENASQEKKEILGESKGKKKRNAEKETRKGD